VIVGIDPSLTGCGVSDGTRHIRIETKAGLELRDRVAHIVSEIRLFIADGATITATAFTEDTMTRSGFITTPRFFIEGPAMGSPRGASHLYEIGWLMNSLDRFARHFGATVTLVQPATLRKFVTGKGNTPKEQLALKCFKRWGIEIEDDRGFNKLEAYCLVQYGAAVLAGEIAHTEIAKRGRGGRRKKPAA